MENNTETTTFMVETVWTALSVDAHRKNWAPELFSEDRRLVKTGELGAAYQDLVCVVKFNKKQN
jgi:hypothetical protein